MYAGKPAGSIHKSSGYVNINLNGVGYRAHRIAYKLATCEEHPQIDHKDGQRANNALANLRPASNATNSHNQKRRKTNTTGVTGVYWQKKCGKWQSCINVGGKQKHLGLFSEKADAVAARKEAEALYGFDPMHGKTAAERAARFTEVAS